MRGTLPKRHLRTNGRRFIPAYAGNTIRWLSVLRTVSVHPRVCGEHHRSAGRVIALDGSSPRMRGTLIPLVGRVGRKRFIPAYAGNTALPAAERAASAVHPRVCGEHAPYEDRRIGIERFIPAYAGNTMPQQHRRARWAVHPRVCGEHPNIIDVGEAAIGSSPRMRGTQAHRS